jgi:DNA replication and repair protein RecF
LYIKSIELKNFRNYESLRLKLTPGINVFYGENGSGKTNVLESIYYMAMTRSFRASEDNIMVKQGKDALSICIDAVDNDIERNYLLEYDPMNRKKSVKENGNRLARMSMAVGKVPVVLFSPENIMIVKGEPSVRRRFIDDLLSQIEVEYLPALLKYAKEISHRNYLLKGVRDGRIKRENLDVWNHQIMEDGCMILLKRQEAVKELNRILEKDLAAGKFSIKVGYSSKVFSDYSEKGIRETYLEFFRTRAEDEIARAITLIGPHRDDLEISYNGQQAKLFASEGQQRMSTILIKLAEGLLIRSKKGSYPVVMLDDFSSELDEPNRGFIGKTFGLFKQILITTTYKENLRGFSAAKEFAVKNGEVKEL